MHYVYPYFKARRLPFFERVVSFALCAHNAHVKQFAFFALYICVLHVVAFQHVAASGDTVFISPTASVFEARIGAVIQPTPGKLRLDIGASVDLVRIRIDSTRPSLRIGADFMTYTRLRSEHNLKFPVETIDYWFGLHAAYAITDNVALRLRAAHISAHLVDGLADTSAMFTGRKPFVYSREFIEALAAYTVNSYTRVYGGGTVITSTQPRSANRLIPQVGLDVNIPIDHDLSVRGGYDWRLIGIDGTYVTAQAAQVGLFWETMGDGRGLMVSVHGYNGRSIHGMFFDQADSYIGIGMQIVW